MDTIFIIIYFIILFLLCVISYLTNSRSKVYSVIVFDFKTNKRTIFIVKSRTKSKTYEIVSKFLVKNKMEGVIIEVCNVCYMTNNTILN